MPGSLFDDPRREFLLHALATGVLAVPGTVAPLTLLAQTGRGGSFSTLTGTVMVDGERARRDTVVTANSIVETAARSRAIFVVGQDAYLMRENSRLALSGDDSTVVQTLRVLTGALLSVFGRRRHRIETPTATIGIRGTGIYVESQADLAYVCTCYGETELVARADPDARETVVTEHHDAPRYIHAKGYSGALIERAPVKNHDDEELFMLESLVGREPPFAGNPAYGRPRRSQRY